VITKASMAIAERLMSKVQTMRTRSVNMLEDTLSVRGVVFSQVILPFFFFRIDFVFPHNFHQDSWSASLDSTTGRPEYEAGCYPCDRHVHSYIVLQMYPKVPRSYRPPVDCID
jgi:hypothetical protein